MEIVQFFILEGKKKSKYRSVPAPAGGMDAFFKPNFYDPLS